MGTSTPFTGLKGVNPLIPSWLPSDDNSGQYQTPQQPQRFSSPKNSFTRFMRSNGQDRKNLGKGFSRYVSNSSGGARTAAQRMGASHAAGERLVGFLSSARNQGVNQALRDRNLGHLAGKPITEVFIGLIDYICPNEGSIDAGISRDAFVETIAELAANGFNNLDNMTLEQMLTVFEIYATKTIEGRLCNDLQLKTIVLPGSVLEIEQIEMQIHDFIKGAVSDAIANTQNAAISLSPDNASAFVTTIYEEAFSILKNLGDQEANKK